MTDRQTHCCRKDGHIKWSGSQTPNSGPSPKVRSLAPHFRTESSVRPTRVCGTGLAKVSVRAHRKCGRATVVSVPPDREAPRFRPKTPVDRSWTSGVLHRNFGRVDRNFGRARAKLRASRPKLRLHIAPRRPPCERSCGRDGPAAYRSSPERVCPRVVPKGRADRDRNGQTPHARAPAGADVMPVGRVSAAPIARSLCRPGVRTTLRARGRLQAVAAGA